MDTTADMDLPKYVYEPFTGPDRIRILMLHGTRDRIECSIEQISVLDGGYSALSYVWGSEQRPFRAIIRDHKGAALGYIPLTENLYNALQDLRDAEQVKIKTFWIDQICINQEGTRRITKWPS
jgi:hypothetical protein